MTRLPLVLSLLLAAGSAACAGNQSMFNPQGPAAHRIADLGWLLIGICLAVYAVVMAALAWALTRRRRSTDNDAPMTKRMATVVAGAVGVTALTLVGLTASSAAVGRGLTTPATTDILTIDVIGHQWWWDFQYRPTSSDLVSSPNELHLPVGVPVMLRVQSRDVVHSFWVPNLHGKRDLIPGEITHMWIQADTPGVYRGQCAEFCGHQHAKMAFNVVAERMDRFQMWMQHQNTPAVEPGTDVQRRGRELFLQSTCATCHTIAGTDAGSRVGPDLTHVGGRLTIASGTLPNTLEHMRSWVSNPAAIRPGVRMPPASVGPDDLEAVLAYLRSLR